ncbi:MAG: protein-L-isoaspartate O-methyltransferase [Gammaproteobacteria bacterium]|nr:protein-L-isoaspartate O-methyltransferase [Gammaproteobacteria bacterium]
MELQQARYNMIEQQIRPWEVLDQRVLDLLESTPREEYVPDAYRQLAYADIAIPLAHGEAMLHPKEEARLLQALDVRSGDTILEVGTGSGYFTSLLAKSGRTVVSVDIVEEFTSSAASCLASHGITNVTFESGDAAAGWDQGAPYDVIAITGSLPVLPDTYKKSLNIGGRLIAIVGTSPVMEVLLVTRVAAAEWLTESLFETDLKPLRNVVEPSRFVF